MIHKKYVLNFRQLICEHTEFNNTCEHVKCALTYKVNDMAWHKIYMKHNI